MRSSAGHDYIGPNVLPLSKNASILFAALKWLYVARRWTGQGLCNGGCTNQIASLVLKGMLLYRPQGTGKDATLFVLYHRKTFPSLVSFCLPNHVTRFHKGEGCTWRGQQQGRVRLSNRSAYSQLFTFEVAESAAVRTAGDWKDAARFVQPRNMPQSN